MQFIFTLFLMIPWVAMGVMLLWTWFKIYRNRKNEKISFFHPASLICTCFGVGRIKPASGTWGTIFATLLIFIYVYYFPNWGIISPDYLLPVFVVVNLVVYFGGVKASNIYMKKTGIHDPSAIVIDEVSGLFVAVLMSGGGYALLLFYDSETFMFHFLYAHAYLVVLFLLFRLFDITKPYPIGWIDKNIKGGHGVMLDDVIAGVFASITFFIIFFVMHYSGAFVWITKIYFPDFVGQPSPERAY